MEGLFSLSITRAEDLLPDGKACTGFTAEGKDGKAFFGHNEDWEKGDYLVLRTYPASDYSSISVVDISEANMESTYGRRLLLASAFFPLAGMNSQGLAVSTYSVDQHRASQSLDKPDIIWSVAIRLMLDKAATVPEALALLDSYDMLIDEGNSLQMLIADATGDSAVAAWVNGAMRITRRSGSWQAVSNFVQWEAEESAYTSCARYTSAKEFLISHPETMDEDVGFMLLKTTAQTPHTQFSVVCNLTEREMVLAFGSKFEERHRFDQ